MQSKFTLESFKESFVWKVNDSGTRQIKEPVLSGSEEPVPTPNHIEMTFCKKKLGRYLEGQGHSRTLQPNCVQPITLLCEVGFYKYFTEMITILRRCVTRKFGSLPWRSRSQDDLAAKSCLAHYFVVWSSILKLLHKNDHHIEKPCHKQHLGCYLEGQVHSMALQQKRVWPITLLFEFGFYK